MESAVPHHLAYAAHLVATGFGVLAILWLTRRREPWPWTPLLLALGVGLMAAATFAASDPYIPFHDFRIAYYPAGQAVLTDPAALQALTARGVSGFVNMPIVAYLFAPFGALPEAWAVGLFTALGLALVAAAWRLLVSLARLGATEAWLLALLFAANGPLLNSLREGNTSHMILFALVAGLTLLRAGRSAGAGAVLAAAAIIKPPLLLFGLFFVLRRDVRGVAGFGGVVAATTLASLAVFGWAQNLQWFEDCVLRFSGQWIAAFNVQSIPAFVARFADAGGRLLDWTAFPPAPGERLAAHILTGLLLLVAAAACLRRTAPTEAKASERLDLQVLLVVCLAVVSSPLSWSHYYGWLLAPVAFFLGADRSATASRLGWLAIFLLTPLVWPLRLLPPLAEVYGAFAVSHLLFGGLLAFGLVAWRLATPGTLPQRVRGPRSGPALPAAK